MNILLFYPSGVDPNWGGTGKVMHELSKYFALDGHNIFFASVHNESGYIPSHPYIILDKTIGGTFNAIRANRLIRFVKEHRIDVIIDNYHNNHMKHINMLCEVKAQTSVRLINLYHTTPNASIISTQLKIDALENDSHKHSPAIKDIIKKLYYKLKLKKVTKDAKVAFTKRLSEYDRLVLLSERYISIVKELTGITDDKKYDAIPNMVGSLEGISKSETKENTIIFVGRMSSEKQPLKALNIWMSIKDMFPNWNIKFIGDGHLLTSMNEIIMKDPNSRCELLGFKEDPTPYYKKAKIIMMTSIYEGFGLVLIEAQRHGVVPIAFNSFKAYLDLINNESSGISVTPYDEREYKNKLSNLLRNEALLSKKSEKALSVAKKYTVEAILPKWYNLFYDLGLK